VEDVVALLATGFDNREQRFDEAAATGALRAEAQLAPDHAVPQRSFRGVVGRFNPRVI